MIKCCKDCPDRHRACHDDCDLYISEKKRDNEIKRRQQRFKLEEEMTYSSNLKRKSVRNKHAEV